MSYYRNNNIPVHKSNYRSFAYEPSTYRNSYRTTFNTQPVYTTSTIRSMTSTNFELRSNGNEAGGESYERQAGSAAAITSTGTTAIDDEILRHENPNNCTDLAPALPLSEYKLMVDNNPRVINIKPRDKVCYSQEIDVRYLKPPEPPCSEDIIIEELPGKQVAPAPALVERVEGARAATPPPIVIREAPPEPPRPLQGKRITIPGKIYPPPARKVVVEKLPPEPPKPPKVIIERWLPYGQQTQRVVHRPAPKKTCFIPDPRNVVIEWQMADVDIRKDVRDLGVSVADPRDYVQRYGSSLLRSDQFPEIAMHHGNPANLQLNANFKRYTGPKLEGDIEALNLIDLDRHGLSYLRASLVHSRSSNNLSSWDAGDVIHGGSSGYLNERVGSTHSVHSYRGETITDFQTDAAHVHIDEF